MTEEGRFRLRLATRRAMRHDEADTPVFNPVTTEVTPLFKPISPEQAHDIGSIALSG